MPGSVRVTIEEPSQIAMARRLAVEKADSIGFDQVRTGQVAIVATEIATNILKHAARGEILLSGGSEAEPVLEVMGLDKGPGMGDVARCFADGFSTGTSPGVGLGAVKRLSSEFDLYSAPGEGTAVLARWRQASARTRATRRVTSGLRFGAVNLEKKGQEVCGDSWGMEQNADFATILVADGLGHGPEANRASQEAVRMLREHPDATPETLIQLSHNALRSFRGAAIAAARIDRLHQQVTFCGMGNVMAQIYSGAQPTSYLVSVNGTAGQQSQRLREFTYPWADDNLIVLWSDGLATGTTLQRRTGLALRDASLIAGVLYRDFSRGNDDATVVVAKAA